MRVVLVGLPGVGKTAVGAALAAELGLPFVDLDDEVTAELGSSPADLLRAGREATLRDAECRALAAGLKAPSVIATGGGTVESPSARDVLRATSVVAWLVAPTATLVRRLEGGDRPLVDGAVHERLAELAARRAPFYAEVADLTVDADGAVDDVVARLVAVVVPA